MNTKIILSAVIALFVISLVLVVATNIENNQTLSERTSAEIYQDFLDSQKRTDSTMNKWHDMTIHSDDDLIDTVNILEVEKEIQSNLYDEYVNLSDLNKNDEQIRSKFVDPAHYGWFSDEFIIDHLRSQKESERDFKITLEHFGCAKTCPVYSVMINGDGTVLYKGLKNVKEIGKQEYEIPTDTLTELNGLLYDASHGNIAEYGSQDEAETTIIITIDYGIVKRIVNHDNSGPESLRHLEDKIEEIAMIKEFVQVS